MGTNNLSRGDIKKQLANIITEGQINLAKWIITLSTGSIVFSVRLIKPETGIWWKGELVFGLGLLVISIVLGVRYVRRSLDSLAFQLNLIMLEDQLTSIRNLDPETKVIINGKEAKVKDAIGIANDIIVHDDKSNDIAHKEARGCYLWHQRLFYFGIILIAFLGLLNI